MRVAAMRHESRIATTNHNLEDRRVQRVRFPGPLRATWVPALTILAPTELNCDKSLDK